jgi:hypothetical protein
MVDSILDTNTWYAFSLLYVMPKPIDVKIIISNASILYDSSLTIGPNHFLQWAKFKINYNISQLWVCYALIKVLRNYFRCDRMKLSFDPRISFSHICFFLTLLLVLFFFHTLFHNFDLLKIISSLILYLFFLECVFIWQLCR